MECTTDLGVSVMEHLGIGKGKYHDWFSAFSRNADYSLVNLAVGLQYLVLLHPDDRAGCFEACKFSPTAKEVYTWMVRNRKVDTSRLMQWCFVTADEVECGASEESLVVVAADGEHGVNPNAVGAVHVGDMIECEYRIGSVCMAGMVVDHEEKKSIVGLEERDAEALVSLTVREIVGEAGVVESEELNPPVGLLDDLVDDFVQAKGLYGLGLTRANGPVLVDHCITEHSSGRKIPSSNDHGYCYLAGFQYEMHPGVHAACGCLPDLQKVIPWYAAAVRNGVAHAVECSVGAGICHFNVMDGDPMDSLRNMLGVLIDNPGVRVGFIDSYPGPIKFPCSCDLLPERTAEPSASVCDLAEGGAVLVSWLVEPLVGCKFQLFERGVYDVQMHEGRLALETGVALLVIQKGMRVSVHGNCLIDTRDVRGNVRLMCVGGVELISAEPGDNRVLQVTVGNVDDFNRWYYNYLMGGFHFPSLADYVGVGVYMWGKDGDPRSSPFAYRSGRMLEDSVLLLSGGLRVVVPFRTCVNVSGAVKVERIEYGLVRVKRRSICCGRPDVPGFPHLIGHEFSHWMYGVMGDVLVCGECEGVSTFSA